MVDKKIVLYGIAIGKIPNLILNFDKILNLKTKINRFTLEDM